MIWGLNIAAKFGKFFPEGEWRGWCEDLTDAFEAMSEDEKTLYENRASAFRLAVVERFWQCDRPPEPELWPDVYRITRMPKDLADMFELNDRLLAVSEPLGKIIEQMEPGVHGFRPIRIETASGADQPGPYHVMRIGRWLTCLDRAASDADALMVSGKVAFAAMPTKPCFAKIAVSQDRAQGGHLWTDTELLMPELFLSDALRAAIVAEGLVIPKHHKMKVVT